MQYLETPPPSSSFPFDIIPVYHIRNDFVLFFKRPSFILPIGAERVKRGQRKEDKCLLWRPPPHPPQGEQTHMDPGKRINEMRIINSIQKFFLIHQRLIRRQPILRILPVSHQFLKKLWIRSERSA